MSELQLLKVGFNLTLIFGTNCAYRILVNAICMSSFHFKLRQLKINIYYCF